MNKSKGRMIKKSISSSVGFSSLSSNAAVLFCMIIANLNSHGKINGGAGYIKDEVCPLIPYFNYSNIPKLLKEISDKTSMKYFESGSRYWIHSVNFLSRHQSLNPKKLGDDLFPSYSGVSQELVESRTRVTLDLPYNKEEVEVEVKEEVEVEEEDKGNSRVALSPLAKLWNEICPDLPQVITVTKERARKEKARLKNLPFSDWINVFKSVYADPFYCGENDRGWVATYDWIISNDEKPLKILEGKNKARKKKSHIDKINESLRNFR